MGSMIDVHHMKTVVQFKSKQFLVNCNDTITIFESYINIFCRLTLLKLLTFLTELVNELLVSFSLPLNRELLEVVNVVWQRREVFVKTILVST